MKIFSGAVLAISCIPSTVAFVGNTQKSFKTQLSLKAENGNNGVWDRVAGPALAGLAGLTLASQMAVGATLDPSSVVSTSPEFDSAPFVLQEDSTTEMRMTRVETTPMSAITGSSIQLADDYLDFSMPSYGNTVSNSAKAKASEGAPAFSNPFGDFGSSSSDTSAEDKAAAKAAKEQAAADKKAADEAAAAQKKADKEARREAEKEKQRLAVQRASEVKEEKAAAAADAAASASYDIPEFKAPDIKVPEFKAPDIKVPEFKAPEIKLPEFKAPDFGGLKTSETKAPDISIDVSEFKAPDIKLPEVSLPKFSMPKMPDMPKVETPSTSFEAPKAPSFSAPSFEAPKVPSFSAPSFSSGGSSVGGYASLDEQVVDDQEERDAAARDARMVFNDADANAKEVESKARKLRSIADDKKKIAKEAKDIACMTRFGGKFICIRPFGIGY